MKLLLSFRGRVKL